MRFARTLIILACTALLLTACNRDAEVALVAVKQNTNPLLAYAPADTPYVFAALEPVPEGVSDAYIARIQPMLDVVSGKVEQFNENYASAEHQGNHMAALASAIMDELGGSVSVEGLKRLGISIQSHHAMYGMGMFPVIRLGLSDAQALRDAIGRIELKAGFELPVSTHNGTDYWRVSEDDMSVGLYIAILDGQVAISFFPVSAQDDLLPALLGQEMPSQSMAATNTLAILNSDKGYTGFGSGILNLESMTNELLDPNSATRSYLGPEFANELPSLDATCVAEIKQLVAKTPRMTAGTTRLTANEFAMRYELEMDGMLAGALSGLVSDTPVAADGDRPLSASLALKVGKLRTFMLEKANAIVASPYQCEHLQEINQNAIQMAQQLNIPMPPMVNNLLGVRVSVNEIDPTAQIPIESGLMAIHVEKPEMFAGMASMLVPGFEELDLANQSEPVRIPAEMVHMQNLDIFALMGDNAIGLAIGENNARGLGEFMAVQNQENGTFFSVAYDSEQLYSRLMANGDFNPNTGDREFDDAVRASYMSLLGVTRLDMRVTDKGLVMDSSMHFQ